MQNGSNSSAICMRDGVWPMTRPSRKYSCILGLLLTFAAGIVHAQQDVCTQAVQDKLAEIPGATGASVYAILNMERAMGCILGPTDISGIEERYQTLFDSTTSATEKAVARTQIFSLSIDQFSGMPSSICDGQQVTGCMIGRHVNKVQELQQALVSSTTDPQDPIISPSGWAVVEFDGTIALSNIRLQPYLQQECATDITDAQCRAAIKLSASFMRTSIAMDQVIIAYNQPMIEANAEFLSQRDQEWDQYFNTVSVQYPWELAFNSRRFTKNNAAELGNFPRAPNSKYVVLHPSLGFEHIDTPLGDSGTNAAVFLELFGYERWRWRDGKANNRWGLSVIASYVNVAGMDDIGYGLLLHTPFKNMAIGAVYRDGDAGSETGIVLNFDLSKFLEQYKNVDLNEFLTP